METRVVEPSEHVLDAKKQRSLDDFLHEFNLSSVDSCLNYGSFYSICFALFLPDEIEKNEWRIREIFDYFDLDQDKVLKNDEWKKFCNWLQLTLAPVSALIIVDVQNDFIDGSLAIRSHSCDQDGVDVIAPINRLIKSGKFDKIVYSLDWHPENHISFYDNLHLRKLHSDSKVTTEKVKPFDKVIFADPYTEQILWPKHCVIDTWGAQLHKDLLIVPDADQVRKGQNPEIDSYSVFFDSERTGSMELQKILRKSTVTDIYVCGLAYDVCVKATCLDGLRLGYALAVIDDCCCGIDKNNIETTKKLISESGGVITNSDEVLLMINEGKRSLVMSHRRIKTMASI